jgi:hypothetical protein
MRSYQQMRRLISAAIVAVAAASCTGSPAAPTAARSTSSTAASRTAQQHVRFDFFGSPAPAGRRCPEPSRAEGAYSILIGPTSGRPGTKVFVAENVPLFNKAGRYLGPNGKIGFWFNLPFDRWTSAYTTGGPPRSANGVPVLHLGEATVADECSYRVMFTVPNVPAGTYGIVAIEHIDGNAAALGKPIEFRVTG